MKNLLEKLKNVDAFFKPTDLEQINALENSLNISFSEEYKSYLLSIGFISYESTEIYGLGIANTSYLNLFRAIPFFREDKGFPLNSVPISDIGDGHYYIYDNETKQVMVWAGSVSKVIDKKLEDFIISLLEL